MGEKPNPAQIRNPIVRKAIQNRRGGFLFFGSKEDKHSDHSDKYSDKHSDYEDYYDHSDSDLRKQGYKEKKGRRWNGAGLQKMSILEYTDSYSDYDVYSDRYDNSYCDWSR